MIEMGTLELIFAASSAVALGGIGVALCKHYQKKRKDRYDLLKTFFIRLSEGVQVNTIDIGRDQLPRISLNIPMSNLKKSQYFEEALRHLAKDIPGFRNELENQQNAVLAFDKYRNQCYINLVYTLTKICTRYKMNVTLDQTNIPQKNVLSVAGILNYLIPWWMNGTDFNHVIRDNAIIIQGGHFIAHIEEDNSNMESMILAMKNDPDALTIVSQYQTRMKIVIATGVFLKKVVERVIAKIEKDEYTTTCDECVYSLRLPFDPRNVAIRLKYNL
jgi:hypothetical protein